LATARTFGGAIPVLPATDVVKSDAHEALSHTTGALVRVQTPQAFRAAPLLSAYRQAAGGSFEGTDTASCVQSFTATDVRVFPGSSTNLKVTYAPDVQLAERLLQDRITRGDTR
jgi:2-C-methyl-D-erythritol 4-phosphate cytidylyltransferase